MKMIVHSPLSELILTKVRRKLRSGLLSIDTVDSVMGCPLLKIGQVLQFIQTTLFLSQAGRARGQPAEPGLTWPLSESALSLSSSSIVGILGRAWSPFGGRNQTWGSSFPSWTMLERKAGTPPQGPCPQPVLSVESV